MLMKVMMVIMRITIKIWKQSFADVLQNRCSQTFRKFYRKTLVLEVFLNKLAGPKAATLLKTDSNTVIFL